MVMNRSGYHIDNPSYPLLDLLLSRGMFYSGTVTAIPGANQFTIPSLAGLGAGKFAGAANPYYAFIIRDASGTSIAPQGELQAITAYATATGTFTTAAFTVAVAVGDEILIVNSAIAYLIISGGGNSSLLLSFFEGWQDEAGIDPIVWTVTNPATGGAWTRGAVGAYLMAVVSPNASENSRLRSNQRWVCAPVVYDRNQILRRLVLEFECYLQLVANVDNANFFMGLTAAVGATRASNNLIGFGLIGDALQTITDDGGAETVNTGFGETMANLNKFKIVVERDVVSFYLNEVRIASHITTLPNAPMYLNFYYPTEAGGPSILSLGTIRLWTEDIAR
jgi:hypothetical protein